MIKINKQFTVVVLISILIITVSCSSGESEYLQLADKTAGWLSSVATEEGDNVFWSPQPDTTKNGSITLYHGSPGPVLFFLELYKASGDENAKGQAVKGADWLISQAHEENGGYYWSGYNSYQGKPYPDSGLYTGTAGVGTVFLEMYKVLNDEKYRNYAKGAADYLNSSAVEDGGGKRWSQVTDIISGTAGTGMFMIKAAEVLNEPEYLETAKQAGIFLIDQATKEDSGYKWSIYKGYNTIYPNFSHGTSGISYYLALLYQKTGDQQFLDNAVKGADWLINNRENPGEGTAWYHHEPDGKELYYVGYCHGPPGTARLFYQLYLSTQDEKWMDLVRESAKWLMNIGLHEKELDGYWNVSQCCGTAGIGDFFANMYKITGDRIYYEWADQMVTELSKQATGENSVLKWFNAENRTRPDEKYTQTGWAQGASGIGLFFLKMYAIENEKQTYNVLALPDCPFEW